MNTTRHLTEAELRLLEETDFADETDLGTPVAEWGKQPPAPPQKPYMERREDQIRDLAVELTIDAYIRRNQPDPSRW